MLISFIGPRTKVKANILWTEIWNIKYSYNRKLPIAPCCYETYICPYIAVTILESHRTSTSVSEASHNTSLDMQKRRRGEQRRKRKMVWFFLKKLSILSVLLFGISGYLIISNRLIHETVKIHWPQENFINKIIR